jgi:hypothetical protein
MSAPPNTADASGATGTTIADSHQPVIVNLRAGIDASAEVAVFGPSEERVSNVVWCTVPLDVSGLYSDPSNALIEFWEPSDAPGTIRAHIAADTRNARGVAQIFSVALANVIKGPMDASAANPFQGYSGSAYNYFDSFGDLVLGYVAENMFGHPSATAAITNDDEIINGFDNDIRATEPITTPVQPTQTDQAIAQRLAAALFDTSGEIATLIARQVIGQDASRATNVDNSTLRYDAKAPLRFYPNDVVYVAITLSNFTSTIGNNPSGVLSQQYVVPTPVDETYYLRIRLASGVI